MAIHGLLRFARNDNKEREFSMMDKIGLGIVFFITFCLWLRAYGLFQTGKVIIGSVGFEAGGGFYAEPYTSIILAIVATVVFIFLVYQAHKEKAEKSKDE